jgi:hypothetical protein
MGNFMWINLLRPFDLVVIRSSLMGNNKRDGKLHFYPLLIRRER